MTRSMLFASVSLVAALALGVAYAQTPPAGQQAQPGAQGAPGAQAGAPGYGQPGTAAPEGQPWPIVFVASVELLRSKDGRDIVLARGLVTSKGWSQPNLIPINQGTPVDGVLDLLFEAASPVSPAPLGACRKLNSRPRIPRKVAPDISAFTLPARRRRATTPARDVRRWSSR